MKLSEAPIGLRVVMIDNAFDTEVRWTHYERREGEAKFTTNPNKPTAFVCAYRLRTVQGTPGEKPRYDTGEHRTETEVDGRIEVLPASVINHDNWNKDIMATTGDRFWVLWGGIFKDTKFHEIEEAEELHGPYHTEAEADRMWKEIMRRNVDRATHRVFVIEVPRPQAA